MSELFTNFLLENLKGVAREKESQSKVTESFEHLLNCIIFDVVVLSGVLSVIISDHLYYMSAIFLFLGFYAMVVYLNSYLDTNYPKHLVTTQIRIPTNGNRFCTTVPLCSCPEDDVPNCEIFFICDYDHVNTQASSTKSCKVHYSHL